ncbi:hypothetical protein TOTSKI_03870 [Facklamia hominis]
MSIIVNLSIIAILFFYLIEKRLIYKTIYSLNPWGCKDEASTYLLKKVWADNFGKTSTNPVVSSD